MAWAFAMVLVVLVTAFGAYAFGRSQSPAGLDPEDKEAVTLYAQALDKVENDYADQKAVDPKKQTYAAIRGMLDSLGDQGHTRFLTPEEVKQNQEDLSGTYVGIGVQLENRDGHVVIVSPIEGSPSEKAGLETGDVLVAVDGKNVRDEDISKIVNQVKGPKGSTVNLTVLRDKKERKFSMQRAEIKAPVVSWALIPGTSVADVRLSSFSDNSAGELKKAFDAAKAAGAKRYILDLRDNPGGRLDQAVDSAGNFLKTGSVVYIRQDASRKREEVKADDGSDRIQAPMTVLVNGGSASSAEILAGALRDNNRAKVIGTRTFGTGTVLSEFYLKDGSAILLGVAEWLTPKGDFIRKTGIEPDIKVKMQKGDEEVTPGDARDLSKQKLLDRDAQLSRAVEELQN